jgi:hypothetical protein
MDGWAGLGWVPMPGWPPVFRPALPTMPRWLMMRAGSKRGNKRLKDEPDRSECENKRRERLQCDDWLVPKMCGTKLSVSK